MRVFHIHTDYNGLHTDYTRIENCWQGVYYNIITMDARKRGKREEMRGKRFLRHATRKALILLGFIGVLSGGQERDRTADTRIFSPLLYQLSYLAKPSREMVGAQGFEPWTQ